LTNSPAEIIITDSASENAYGIEVTAQEYVNFLTVTAA
jgi:hypothetical protein